MWIKASQYRPAASVRKAGKRVAAAFTVRASAVAADTIRAVTSRALPAEFAGRAAFTLRFATPGDRTADVRKGAILARFWTLGAHAIAERGAAFRGLRRRG